MAFTPAVLSTSLLPPGAQSGSVRKSMSYTSGLTGPPPVNGTAEMLVSIPPLAAKSQWPEGGCAAWSWYWGRVWSGGCQHAPVMVSHATGAGHPAIAQVAVVGSAATMASTNVSTFISMVPASPVVAQPPCVSSRANVPSGP